MSFWKPPPLPKSEKMPPPRPAKGPSRGGRLLAAVAAVAFLVAAGVGFMRALDDPTGRSSPVRALVMLIPAGLLGRYALTGQAKKP
jgi:hypothetical protein